MKQQKWLVVILAILVVLGSASGWIYNTVKKPGSTLSKDEITNLQVSFMKQYGTDASISEGIVPKVYEVAWVAKDGTKNVSMNVGGIWVLIASVPATSTTSSP